MYTFHFFPESVRGLGGFLRLSARLAADAGAFRPVSPRQAAASGGRLMYIERPEGGIQLVGVEYAVPVDLDNPAPAPEGGIRTCGSSTRRSASGRCTRGSGWRIPTASSRPSVLSFTSWIGLCVAGRATCTLAQSDLLLSREPWCQQRVQNYFG